VKQVFAAKEVILSGGPINNPQLLMLSGIGPVEQLNEHGIELKHELPGVGQNLQDHLEIYLQMECTQPVSLFKYYNLVGKAITGAQWLFTRTGLGARRRTPRLAVSLLSDGGTLRRPKPKWRSWFSSSCGFNALAE